MANLYQSPHLNYSDYLDMFNQPKTSEEIKIEEIYRSATQKVEERRSNPQIKYDIDPATKFRNKDGYQNLRYPYESIDKDHDYMSFTVYEYKRPFKKNSDVDFEKLEKSGGASSIGDRNRSVSAVIDADLQGDILGKIILPIPSQINDTNNTNYGEKGLNFMEQSMTTTVANMMEGNPESGMNALFKGLQDLTNNENTRTAAKTYAATQALKAIGINLNLNDVLARTSGSILNPNMELLFNGPTLRQFKFQFKFTPRFKKESDAVQRIIKVFKKSMSPRGIGSDFLKTPHIFKLQYIHKGALHPFLNEFKLCALTGMNVNYTSEGNYATYTDGTPISLTMDLAFQELTPIYNEDYSYDISGVGY